MTSKLKTIRAQLKADGIEDITITYSAEWEEYRVNFRGGSEATAYYTNDADDALGTARAMHKRPEHYEGRAHA